MAQPGLLTLAELLALAPWFSAAAVAPLIQAEWHLTAGAAAWLTLAVQLGFVAGTLVSGVLNLPDRFDAARLFALSAAGAALTTAGFALVAGWPAGRGGAAILDRGVSGGGVSAWTEAGGHVDTATSRAGVEPDRRGADRRFGQPASGQGAA